MPTNTNAAALARRRQIIAAEGFAFICFLERSTAFSSLSAIRADPIKKQSGIRSDAASELWTNAGYSRLSSPSAGIL